MTSGLRRSAITALVQGHQPVRMEHHQARHEGAIHKTLGNHEQRQVAQVFVDQLGKSVHASRPQHYAHHHARHGNRNAGAKKPTKEDIGEEIAEIPLSLP